MTIREGEISNKKLQNRIFEVQMMYWKGEAIISFEEQEKLNKLFKNHLQETRNLLHKRLHNTKEFAATPPADTAEWIREFSDVVPPLSIDCTQRMLKLSNMIMEQSVAYQSAKPPCAFSAVAIGSMAKGEATPYSDLEFLFLIEKKSEPIIRYFENLAMTVYFFIGNLGETKLSYMAIDELHGWFSDTCQNGFKIDGLAKGAGNIPTGNGSTNQKNHFILTVDELILKYRKTLDQPDKKEAVRGDFTAMMAFTKQFYHCGCMGGHLLEEFKRQQEWMTLNAQRIDINRAMLEADVAKYGFKPNQKIADRGYVIDSKRDVYRYPSIMLFNITILTQTSGPDSWCTLDLLRQRSTISETVYRSLKFLLCCACYFRLSAYLHHNSHDDRISILQEDERSNNIIHTDNSSSSRWFVPQELFNIYCEIMVPMKRHFANGQNRALQDLLTTKLENSSWHTKFITLHCCHRWREVWKLLDVQFGENVVLGFQDKIITELIGLDISLEEVWQSVKALSYTLYQKREYKAALTYHKTVLERIELNPNETKEVKQLLLADIFDETANTLVYLHKHDEACSYYLSSYEIRKKVLDPTDMLLGDSNLRLGRCYRIQKNLQLAEKHLLQALTIFHYNESQDTLYEYRGDEIAASQPAQIDFGDLNPLERLDLLNNPSVNIVHTLLNLADILRSSKYYSLTRCYALKVFNFVHRIYGTEANHRLIADVGFVCACSCSDDGDHRQADEFFCRSLEMITKLFTGTKESVFKSLSGSEETDEWGVCDARAELIVNTFCDLPGYRVPHPQSANVMKRFGQHMTNVKRYSLAITCLERALAMYRKSFGEKAECFDVASTSAYLGIAIIGGGSESATGMDMCNNALDMLLKIGDKTSLLQLAEVHEKLAQVLQEQGNSRHAEHHITEALLTYKEYADDPYHPKIRHLQRLIELQVSI